MLFLAALLIIFSGSVVINTAVFVIALLALLEMYKSLGFMKNQKILSSLGFIYTACVFGFCVFNKRLNLDAFTAFVFKASLIYALVMLIYMVLRFEKVHFSTVSAVFLVTMYIDVLLAHIILINTLNNANAVIWLVILGACGSDTFAYFTGRFFGKHKLIEKVSPKKTIEGAIGAVLGTALLFVIYALILTKLNFGINYVNLIITAVLASVISQFGDLIASCIKRENNIKDYGYIIPGHGGILDRFDSIILVSPFIFYMALCLPSII